MDKILLEMLQAQLTRERQNAAAYDCISAAANVVNYAGTAKWAKDAADDERKHASYIEAHIIDRNEIPVYGQINACPAVDGNNLPGMFMFALELERQTTEALKTLYYVAAGAEDVQALAFLQDTGDGFSFFNEQTQSEREITDILQSLGRVDHTGWLVIDNSLK